MRALRGRFTGEHIQLLESATIPPNTHVLVVVLDGEMERAAARLDRQGGVPSATAPEPVAPRQSSATGRPLTVGEIMTETVVTVNARMSVVDAMHRMSQEGITSVVIEPGAAGDWGIMTIRDVLDRIVRANRTAEHVAVGELASRPLVTATRDMNLSACSDLMVNQKVRRLVIMEHNRPVGIVSETDIFRVVQQHGWGDQA